MRLVLSAALAVLAFTPALRALEGPPEKAKTPRERYQAIFQEHQKAMQDFSDAYQKAKTDKEREKQFEEKYPKADAYAARFLEVAESAPKDPAAVDALIWVVQNGGAGPEVARAIDRLAKDHAADRRMGEVAPRLVHQTSPSAETLLRAIVEKNPRRDAKGIASLALGQYLKQRADLARTIKENPSQAKQIEVLFTKRGIDKEYFAALKRKDPDALLKEAEAAFERTAKEFGDVDSGRGTLAKTAEAELYEIRNLAVGKPAPEIAGTDTDGKAFKLSDYKGKVVVVDFWGDW